MNIEELIHDLRARINPQYFDQPGTESHERYQVVMALEYLRQENTRLHENAKTIGELEQLAARSNNNLLVENERLREENERLRNIERAAQWYVDNPNSQRMAISQIKSAIDAARGGK